MTLTCGTCGRSWNYETPAGRCPYEADHEPITVRYVLTIEDTMTDNPPAVESEHINLQDAVAMMVEHLVALNDPTVRLFPTAPEQEDTLEWRIEADTFDGEPEDDEAPQDWWARIVKEQ